MEGKGFALCIFCTGCWDGSGRLWTHHNTVRWRKSAHILNPGTRWRRKVNLTLQPLDPWGNTPLKLLGGSAASLDVVAEVKHPAGIEHWLVTFFFTSELILSSVMKFCSIWRHIWERYCTRQASQPTRRRARLANQASTRMSLPSRADTCFAVGSWCGASVFFRLASCFYMLCGQWQVLERSTATVLKYTFLEPDVAVSSTNIIYVLVV